MNQSWKYWWWTFAGIVGIGGVFAFWDTAAVAQITPDTTLGTENSVVTPNVDIQGLPVDLIEGGATRDAALFHSFSEFNVGEGLRVYFANPVGIETIFSRVTGSDVSDILGTLGVNGGASLFLLNPNGIIFGENARLDIAGSFVASTANSVVFENGVEFSATNPEAPPLLTINLTPGLQYGSNSNGKIANAGTLQVGQDLILGADNLDLQGQLEAGENLTLTAKDTVTIRDSVVNPFIATAGEQLLIQGNQTIDIFTLNHPDSGLFSGGNMVLRSANTVGGDAHYWSGGSFAIEQLDGSLGGLSSPNDPIIRANGDVAFNFYEGASLHILAGGSVTIPGYVWIQGADPINGIAEEVILSDGTTVGIDGRIQPTLDIRAGTTAFGTPFFNTGEPTSADIKVGTVFFADPALNPLAGTVLLTNQYQPNPVLMGDIEIYATLGNFLGDNFAIWAGNFGSGGLAVIDSRGHIKLDGIIQTTLSITVPGFPGIDFLGNGGNVSLLAGNDITLNPGSIINARGLVGGDINLKSGRNIFLNDSAISNNSWSTVPGSTGGDIRITANSLFINNSSLESSTFGQVNAGDINITVSENATIIGAKSGIYSVVVAGAIANAGDINITAESLSIADNATIQTTITEAIAPLPAGQGKGGDINISAGSLFVNSGAQLATSTRGKGDAGNITINSRDITSIDGVGSQNQPSGIFSRVESEAVGKGGVIDITTESLSVTNSAEVTVRTAGEGKGGNLIINSSDSVQVIGNSSLSVGTLGNSDAGNLEINTSQLLVKDGAFIDASTFEQGEGKGGNLIVNASDSVQVIGNSGLLATTFGNGDAGNLEINTSQLLVQDDATLTTSTFKQGEGGSLIINASDSVQVIDASSLLAITSGNGDAGNLEINTSAVQVIGNSGLLVTAYSNGDAGNLEINTSQLLVKDGAFIDASTFEQGEGGSLIINASDSVQVIGNSGFSAATLGSGDAGNLEINTSQLLVQDDAKLRTSTFERGEGKGGNLIINASDSVQVIGNSGLSVATSGNGDAGNLEINTSQLLVQDDATLTSSTLERGEGGSLIINASDSVQVIGNSVLLAEASGNGDAGNLEINTSSVQVIGNSGLSAGTSGNGDAGNLEINTSQLLVQDGAFIDASTSEQGEGGSLIINASDSVQVMGSSSLSAATSGNGDAGNLEINTSQLLVQDGAFISASTFEQGEGGSLIINASDSVQVMGSSSLSAATSGNGDAGNLEINTFSVQVIGNSGLSAGTSGNGDAGNLEINTSQLLVQDGAFISASTFEQGEGGSLIINAFDEIQLSGAGGLLVDATAGGTAGDLTVTTRELQVNEGAQVTVSSPQGQAGNLTIAADSIVLNQGTIFAETGISSAQGGANIILDELNLLFLENESLISASALADANGGNVTIDSTFIIALPPTGTEGSDIIANAVQGNGGRVSVTTQGLFDIAFRPQRTPLNDITVSSEFGLDGVFVENRPDIDPNRGLTELENNFVDAERLIDRSCNAGGAALASSFIFTGRGGIPPSPLDVLESDVMVSDWVTLDEETPTQTQPESVTPNSNQPRQIIEAQGWVKLANGQIMLVAESPTVTPQVNWQNATDCESP